MCIAGFVKAPFYVRNNSYWESKHRGTSTIGNYIQFWHVCDRSQWAEIELNFGTFFLRYVELCIKYVDVLLASAVRPNRGFDGFFAGLFITSVCRLDGPKAVLICQISAKQKDDINTTKTNIARKH